MSTTTTKRGSGTKFLALLASLTMLIAGLVGVAVAAPASANPTNGAESNSPSDVCDALLGKGNWTWVDRFDVKDKVFTGQHVTVTGLPADSGKWSTDAYVAAAQVHAGNTGGTVTGVPGADGGTWSTNGQTISTLTFCGGTAPQKYEYKVTKTFTKEICKDGQTVTPEPVSGTEVKVGPQDTPVSVEQKAIADGQAEDNAEAAFDEEYEPYTDGPCDGDDYSYKVTKTFTKQICKAGQTVTPEPVSGSEVVVGPQDTPVSAEQKAIADGQAEKSAEAAFDELYEPYTDGSCGGGEPNKRTVINCADQTQEQTQNQDGSWPAIPSGYALSKADLVCGTTTTEEPPAPPVVQEAQVVAAPAPATVAVPAPAKVAVPAKATLPAAVPAGEGSGTGLPLWALAMITVGMIGTVFAGKQLLGARK